MPSWSKLCPKTNSFTNISMSSEMLVSLKFQITDLNRKTTKGSISQQGQFLALYQIDRDKPNHLVYKLLPEKWRDTKPVNIMFCIPIMFFGIKKKNEWNYLSNLKNNVVSPEELAEQTRGEV